MWQRMVPALLVLPLVLPYAAAADDNDRPAPLTPWEMRALYAKKLTGKALERFRDRIYATFGKREMQRGIAKARVQDTMVAWAIAITPEQAEAGVVPKLLLGAANNQRADMQPIGEGSNVFVVFADLPNFSDLTYAYDVSGRRTGAERLQIEHYNPDPDSFPHQGVPKGKVTRHTWKSKIFEGTVRDYWVYVPARYDPDGPPACVMVFQDGQAYLGDPFRTTTVLDNLIDRRELPVIIGVFINPGVFPAEDGGRPRSNRSVEYDTLSDRYARFLRDEILPEVGKKYHLRKDAASRAIGGISSGGICSFTAAWEMPDQFARVLSHVGSFTDIRGGDKYPSLIRKHARKPIRVYLQDGARDLDNEFGNWPLANQQMAAALRFKGYDFTLVLGQGFHNGKHGASVLGESLRWLWRDYRPAEPKREGPRE